MTDVGSKLRPAHLRRDAYVYVRQSTLTQVREHTESLERQYELAGRAQALVWTAAQVVLIDEDLCRSGADATAREGFKNLVADVGLPDRRRRRLLPPRRLQRPAGARAQGHDERGVMAMCSRSRFPA